METIKNFNFWLLYLIYKFDNILDDIVHFII